MKKVHRATRTALQDAVVSYVGCEMSEEDYLNLFGKPASPFSITVRAGIVWLTNGPKGMIDIQLIRHKGNSTAQLDQQLADTLLTSIIQSARAARSTGKSHRRSS